MRAPWEADLAPLLEALGIRTRLPEELTELLRDQRLASNNTDAATLAAMRLLADIAVDMTVMLFPSGTQGRPYACLAFNTPASHKQLVEIIIATEPQHPTPTPPTRRNVAQLVCATRAVARGPEGPAAGIMSSISTARFVAMWSTIYGEFVAAGHSEAYAIQLVRTALQSNNHR